MAENWNASHGTREDGTTFAWATESPFDTTSYVAYAITPRGRELIESYETAQEAIDDMLELWPEDDNGDVSIETENGFQVAYFARSAGNPNIVHVYHIGRTERSVSHTESYRCEYKNDLETGRLYTQIDRIA